MNKKLSGSLMLLIATVIWGSAFVSQSTAMAYMGPFSFQTVRCFMAVCVMIPIVLIADSVKHRRFFRAWKHKKLWIAGVLCGIPLFLACNLQQLALVDTDAGKSGFLTAMYIVFVPLIGLLRRKKCSVLVPVSLVLAVVGLYLLSCAGETTIQTGDLLLLGCAVMFAVQINVVDHYVKKVDPLRFNAIQILICTLLSGICMLVLEEPSLAGIQHCLPQLAHVGFLSMGVSYGLQILAQKNLAQTTAALIMSLESVFAALFGWLMLGEMMQSHELIGCLLLFIAIIVSQIDTKPKKKVA